MASGHEPPSLPALPRRKRAPPGSGRDECAVVCPSAAGGTSAAMATASAADRRDEPDDCRAAARAPGIVLGIGLGGFLDGIVLHQILQWHHMLSDTDDHPATTVAGLEANTLADGLFHAATWIAVVAGIGMLWRRPTGWPSAISWRSFVGWLLVGWGLFNVVEGVVNHHLLGIHHVREGGSQTAWDLAFLAFGGALAVGGRALAHSEVTRLRGRLS
jgi:uncharacterized membrane protein